MNRDRILKRTSSLCDDPPESVKHSPRSSESLIGAADRRFPRRRPEFLLPRSARENSKTPHDNMSYSNTQDGVPQKPQVQACRYKTGKTLGAGSYSVVKECVHIDTGRYYAAKVINKRLMAGREHMVSFPFAPALLHPDPASTGSK